MKKVSKSWGTDIVPKKKWINCNKKYKTREGKEVTDLRLVLKNSLGDEVTFSIKGSIKISHKKSKCTIWTLDGRNNILEQSKDDLIEVLDKLKK